MKAGMTAPIRVLIVDDEPLARERIASLLEAERDIECVGECGDGRTAVNEILETSPDAVFLDVQMPEMDGFAVLRAVPPDRMPIVVFVTAFDSYALRAFDFHALDYLLKPFDRDRFAESLIRVREQLQQRREGKQDERLIELIRSLRGGPEYIERFVVKAGNRIFFVKAGEIDWIEAAGNYVRLHAGKDTHLVRETMNRVETKLDPKKFARIHRSTVVNLDRIKELQPWFHGEYVIILRDGSQLTLSRGYREKLQKILGDSL